MYEIDLKLVAEEKRTYNKGGVIEIGR